MQGIDWGHGFERKDAGGGSQVEAIEALLWQSGAQPGAVSPGLRPQASQRDSWRSEGIVFETHILDLN
jgi:hypothetical protein